MRSLQRLKAYFGMVPAQDMEDYLDYDEASDDLDGDYPAEIPEPVERTRYPAPPMRAERSRPRGAESLRAGSRPLVRGALAVDADEFAADEFAADEAAVSFRENDRAPSLRSALPAERGAVCRITTLQPRSYNEARTVGERYRDGIPVIMNLTDLDDAAAKRLVDFAAGLAFALRGSIDKVTSRVFLLSPPGVEVAASDARRLAERGLFGQN